MMCVLEFTMAAEWRRQATKNIFRQDKWLGVMAVVISVRVGFGPNQSNGSGAEKKELNAC